LGLNRNVTTSILAASDAAAVPIAITPIVEARYAQERPM